MELVKLTVSIRQEVYETLTTQAESRKITVHEFLRAVVLPEWIAHAKPVEAKQA